MTVTLKLTGSLDKTDYDIGADITVSLKENVPKPEMKLTFTVTDNLGHAWTQVSQDTEGAVFRAKATTAGSLVVTAKLVRAFTPDESATWTGTATIKGGGTTVGTALIGATVGHDDGGLNVIADIRRSYNQGGLPASVDSALREASNRCRVGGVVWTSYKGAKPSDSSLRGSLKMISDFLHIKDQLGWVTYEHEPDIKGGVSSSVYHAGYDQLEKIIVEFGNLSPIVCLTGFSGDKDPSIWETYWRPSHKVIGFDHYNKGHQRQGEPMSTPAENYGPLLAFAKGKGKKAALGETGVGDDAVPGSVIKTREQWYSEARKFILDPKNNFAGACAFDSGLALLSQSEAKAWYAK